MKNIAIIIVMAVSLMACGKRNESIPTAEMEAIVEAYANTLPEKQQSDQLQRNQVAFDSLQKGLPEISFRGWEADSIIVANAPKALVEMNGTLKEYRMTREGYIVLLWHNGRPEMSIFPSMEGEGVALSIGGSAETKHCSTLINDQGILVIKA